MKTSKLSSDDEDDIVKRKVRIKATCDFNSVCGVQLVETKAIN